MEMYAQCTYRQAVQRFNMFPNKAGSHIYLHVCRQLCRFCLLLAYFSPRFYQRLVYIFTAFTKAWQYFNLNFIPAKTTLIYLRSKFKPKSKNQPATQLKRNLSSIPDSDTATLTQRERESDRETVMNKKNLCLLLNNKCPCYWHTDSFICRFKSTNIVFDVIS